MISKQELWFPSGQGTILRILLCEEDGCILYSWRDDKITFSGKVPTFIRLFNPTFGRDVIILAYKSNTDIISASLSPDRKAVGFTVWISQEPLECKNHVKIATALNSSPEWEKIIIKVSDSNPITTNKPENFEQHKRFNINQVYHNGIYHSFLAEVYPTDWSMKFTTDRKLHKQVMFTNHVTQSNSGDLQLITYEVILCMHREYIGLYSVKVHENSSQKATCSSNKRSCNRVYGCPKAEMITDKLIWCQWDSLTQRLYYLVPAKRNKKLVGKSTHFDESHQRFSSFGCVQFYQTLPHKKVLDIKLDFGISKSTMFSRSSYKTHSELNPTMSSQELVMRIHTFTETGTMCVCWQELPSQDVRPIWYYSIAILSKDLLIRFPLNNLENVNQVSFLPLGHLLFVHSAGEFLHTFDIESMSCEKRTICNGLYHMLLPESMFLTFKNSSFEFLMPIHGTNHNDYTFETTKPSISSQSADYVHSTLFKAYPKMAVGFDKVSGCCVSIVFDLQQFHKLFNEESLNLKNRIFLTRFAAITSRSSYSPEALSDILELVIENPSNLHVTGVLAQLIITMTTLELNDYKINVPPSVFPLFPAALPSSSLSRLFYVSSEKPGVEYFDVDICKYMTLQIEQYLSSISLNLGFVAEGRGIFPSVLSIDDTSSGNPTDLDGLWYRNLNACKTGFFTNYDLGCIKEEMMLLKEAIIHLGQPNPEAPSLQSGELLARLARIFEKDFLQTPTGRSTSIHFQGSESNIFHGSILSFLNENERIQTSENIIVLTSEKLCDHLSAYWHDNSSTAQTQSDVIAISRHYVYGQIRAVHHTLVLLMLKSGVEDFARALFEPASAKEQILLTVMKQFQLACTVIWFPLPNGFHTFMTCLTFRCLLAKFSPTIRFQVSFFACVNRGEIELTPEFVARVLEELGERKYFSEIVHNILKRTRQLNNMTNICGIDQWNHPVSRSLQAKACVKDIYEQLNVIHGASTNGSKEKSKQTNTFNDQSSFQIEDTVATYLKKLSNSRSPSPTSVSSGSEQVQIEHETTAHVKNFPPLQSFIEFVKHAERGTMLTKKRTSSSGGKSTIDLFTSSLAGPAGNAC